MADEYGRSYRGDSGYEASRDRERPRRGDYPEGEIGEANYRRAVAQYERGGAEDRSDDEASAAAAAQADRDRAYDESHTSDEGWDPFAGRGTGRGGGGSGGGGGDTNTWNDWAEGVPILDWLTGQEQDAANSAADAERARHEGYWGSLVNDMPTEDELSVEYGNEDMISDTTAEGALARENWTDWAEGGFTDADRAMMDESRRRSGMTARADREANMSAMEARGMGGSGAELAGMLSAGEGAADRGASMDATMMGAAQQRQIGATGALADWASGETEYGRGREGRNTDRENRTRESASEAAQGAYENRERLVSGLDNQYGGGRHEDDDSDEAAAGFLGGIVEEIF